MSPRRASVLALVPWTLLAGALSVGAQETVAIQVARMLDVESGRMVADPVVLVEGDGIRADGTDGVLEAIRSATVHAADLLGVDDRGAIEEGRLADLVAVAGDPLEDVRVLEDIHWVMLGGEVVKERAR